MNGMAILGVGAISIGSDEPFSDRTAQLEHIPIKDVAPPKVSRRYGRLSKMVAVAAHRALADAGIESPEGIPVVTATCLGETGAALGILEQIHQTRGGRISPALVPNSVHNAAAGYLLISTKNRAPSITVSQGWLSSEAAFAAAQDILTMGRAEKVLVVSGDEADPMWIERLRRLGSDVLAASLEKEAFQEGSTAWVLGVAGDATSRGIVKAALERCPITPNAILALFEKCGIRPTESVVVRLRKNGNGERLRPLIAEILKLSAEEIQLDGIGPGTVQSAPLLALMEGVSKKEAPTELLLLGAEAEEVGIIYYRREK